MLSRLVSFSRPTRTSLTHIKLMTGMSVCLRMWNREMGAVRSALPLGQLSEEHGTNRSTSRVFAEIRRPNGLILHDITFRLITAGQNKVCRNNSHLEDFRYAYVRSTQLRRSEKRLCPGRSGTAIADADLCRIRKENCAARCYSWLVGHFPCKAPFDLAQRQS